MLREQTSVFHLWSTFWALLQACPGGVSRGTSVGYGGFVEVHMDIFGLLACEDIGSYTWIDPPEPPLIFLWLQLKKIDLSSTICASFAFSPHLTNHSFLIFLNRICTKIVYYILNPWVQREQKTLKY